MCLAEFERFEQKRFPTYSLKESWGNRRRGEKQLPRDAYHVLTTCLVSVLLGCHKDDTHNRDRIEALGLKVKKNQFTLMKPLYH